MPIKETVTTFETDLLVLENVIADGSYPGQILNVNDYDRGLAFAFGINGYTGPAGIAGTKLTLKIKHGDESDLSDGDWLPKDMLIYGSKKPDGEEYFPWIQGYNNDPTDLAKRKLAQDAIFSTKQYVQPIIVVETFAGDPFPLFILAIKNPLLIPVLQQENIIL